MIKNLIKINDLSKIYKSNNYKVSILKKVNFYLNKGDIISIIGPSGSGKSTFLNILGLLDSDYEGNYNLLDQNVNHLNFNKKNIMRNRSIGFVHQFFYLIPELNVLENILLPNLINNNFYSKSSKKAEEIIYKFGLKERMYNRPSDLSGGEQQRVAIARALINDPDIVIADEMTGNLDEKTANSVFDFFLNTIKSHQQSLIYVTHNSNYANKANKVFKISNQELVKVK